MKTNLPRKKKKALKKVTQELIIVCYMNIGNIPNSDVQEYMSKVAKSIQSSKDKITHYFIPVRDQETRIECINPVRVDNKTYEHIKQKLSVAQKTLDEILNNMKHE